MRFRRGRILALLPMLAMAASTLACGALLGFEPAEDAPAEPDELRDPSADGAARSDSPQSEANAPHPSSDYFTDDFPEGFGMDESRWERVNSGGNAGAMRLNQSSRGLEITPTPLPGDNQTGYSTTKTHDFRDAHMSVVLAEPGSGGTDEDLGGADLVLRSPGHMLRASYVRNYKLRVYVDDVEQTRPPDGFAGRGLRIEIRHETLPPNGAKLTVWCQEAGIAEPTVLYGTTSFDVSQATLQVMAGGQDPQYPTVWRKFVFAPNN